MRRRRFLHTFLAAPALAPLLWVGKRPHPRGDLYLISDEPEAYLPLLLAESTGVQSVPHKTFTFHSPHPRRTRLLSILNGQGWAQEADPAQALLTLSFGVLRNPSRPSFTFVQDGRIRDIRSRKLRALWDQMGREARPSTSLTIAGFRPAPIRTPRGEFAAIYHEGHMVERIRLDRIERKTLTVRGGTIVVRVDHGSVRVAESPCRHQVCRRTRPITLSGQRIICAPNHLLLEIQGPQGLDTVIG